MKGARFAAGLRKRSGVVKKWEAAFHQPRISGTDSSWRRIIILNVKPGKPYDFSPPLGSPESTVLCKEPIDND
jgi:hypothetical protein